MPPQSTTEKISGAFRNASHSVTDALTHQTEGREGSRSAGLGQHAQGDRHRSVLSGRPGRRVQRQHDLGRCNTTSGDSRTIRITSQPSSVSHDLHDRRDEFHKAEKLYRRAVEAEPENAMAHNDLGLCLARHDRNDEAVVSLRKACQLEPDRKLYHNNLATVLVAMGRVDEAYETTQERQHRRRRALQRRVPAVSVQQERAGPPGIHVGLRGRRYVDRRSGHAEPTRRGNQSRDEDTGGPGSRRTPVAKEAAPTLAAPEASAKVQYRIEDLAPQATNIRKRTEAQPVALVRSGEPLRRTPATDATSESGTPTESPARPRATNRSCRRAAPWAGPKRAMSSPCRARPMMNRSDSQLPICLRKCNRSRSDEALGGYAAVLGTRSEVHPRCRHAETRGLGLRLPRSTGARGLKRPRPSNALTHGRQS